MHVGYSKLPQPRHIWWGWRRALRHLLHKWASWGEMCQTELWPCLPRKLRAPAPQTQMEHSQDQLCLHAVPHLQGRDRRELLRAYREWACTASQPQRAGLKNGTWSLWGLGSTKRWETDHTRRHLWGKKTGARHALMHILWVQRLQKAILWWHSRLHAAA